MRWGIAVVVVLLMPASAGAQARITSAPPAETEATDATFAFEDAALLPLGGGFECSLDGAPYAPCSSPHTITGLLGGPHVFRVRLSSLIADRRPAEHAWTVLQRSEILPPPDPPPVRPPVRPRDERRRDGGGCAYGANRPGEVRASRLARATACLVNRRRASAGLRIHARTVASGVERRPVPQASTSPTVHARRSRT